MEEPGVADDGRREGGGELAVRGGLAAWAAEVWRVYVDVCAFLRGCGWSRRCWMVSWA